MEQARVSTQVAVAAGGGVALIALGAGLGGAAGVAVEGALVTGAVTIGLGAVIVSPLLVPALIVSGVGALTIAAIMAGNPVNIEEISPQLEQLQRDFENTQAQFSHLATNC